MIAYSLRRIGQSIIIMLLVSILAFIMLHLLPGGLIRAQLGGRPSRAEVAQLTQQEGLNRALPVQYLLWLWHAVQGNLGSSYKLNQTVVSLLAEYLPRTLLLVGSSVLLALAIALPIGMWQGARRNRWDDHSLTGVMMFFYSMPSFLLGVILIVLLNEWLLVFPATASNYGASLGTDLTDLILPVATLTLGTVAYFSRYMRSAVIDNLLEDYVRTAYAKGASERQVMLRHVFRNSLLSTVTLVGLSIPYVLSGSLVVEALFNFPGIGLLFWNAAQSRDYPILLGVIVVVTFATIVGSLMADLAYGLLDPRIRYR